MMWIPAVFAVGVGGWYVSAHNRLIKLRNKCEASWAQIDVVTQRRYDLIPNLVACVKASEAHDTNVVDKLLEARNAYAVATTTEAKMMASGEITSAFKDVEVLSQSVPDLVHNETYVELQKQLKETEDKLQYARQFYNDDVKAYANAIDTFPSSIAAKMGNFAKMPYLGIAPEERDTPEVKF